MAFPPRPVVVPYIAFFIKLIMASLKHSPAATTRGDLPGAQAVMLPEGHVEGRVDFLQSPLRFSREWG